ncbi:hypothetical protein [uncultured Reyranella sp.]|uniref:hypothetical protein n=1 Tax=uncultured Reyranella sp. TaxID=735512 RepID=UPI0025EA300E|nr:hypothetical protein [uncultured Reyranella sp.]
MASIMTEGLLSAAPDAEPWPRNELGGDSAFGLQADEMFARRLDTRFAGEVRGLVTDPVTGLAGRDPEEALAGIAETTRLLGAVKDRYLAQAIGPRQKALLEPLFDRRLDRAGGELGRIAEKATSVLDDRIVAERLADLARDAALSWQDAAHLRTLGATAVGELRYQGERKGWDAGRTDRAVRSGLSDLYAGAVEAAIGHNPERAAKLYDHARDVIQPERRAVVERRIERAREERRVTEIVGGLADTPDDPTRRPDLDDYQARAADATPPDASPEVRAQVTRMARIEQARAERAWQAARGRAATSALDWLDANPAAPLVAMPTALRDGLSPEQTEALDRTAMNGGRIVTDRDLYEKLDDQAVHEPESFAGLDLTQYRLSLGDIEYNRLTNLQKTLAEGKPDPDFERHRLGRLFLGEGLRAANHDPDGEEARTARQQLDTLLGAFEPIEGKPPTMADIRGLVGDVVGGLLPHGEGDPNIVRVSGDQPAEALPPELEAKGVFDGAEPHIASVDAVSTPSPNDEVVLEESTGPKAMEAAPTMPPAPDVTRFVDGTKQVTRRGVDTERGKADVTEAYDEQDRIVSTDATFADGHRVESRWSFPAEGHWSQVDTIRDPEGKTLGVITTTFDGERVTRTVEPINGPPQTDIWDRDGPVPTMQNVVAPALAIPFLLDLAAAAIGAVIVGKAIDDTIARQGTAGGFGGNEMARPPGKEPGPDDNGPPERVAGDKRPPSRPPVPPFPPGQRPSWRQSELDDMADRYPDFASQVAFKDGREVSSRTPGSVRPDGVSADKRSASFEVKNYDINTNADGLVNRVARQVQERARHLPRSMKQNIKIDVRGQNVSSGHLDDIARRIVEKSNGLLRYEDIEFVRSY